MNGKMATNISWDVLILQHLISRIYRNIMSGLWLLIKPRQGEARRGLGATSRSLILFVCISFSIPFFPHSKYSAKPFSSAYFIYNVVFFSIKNFYCSYCQSSSDSNRMLFLPTYRWLIRPKSVNWKLTFILSWFLPFFLHNRFYSLESEIKYEQQNREKERDHRVVQNYFFL